ncbi:MAG: RnfABCDGE type electron transport complex subunit D [Clostridia bacterium]|nr:RnfABCDGE type electron transport complex subunit D [Clostridia bacterium]
MENLKFTVSSTPHIRANNSVDDIMLDVILALMPAAFVGVYYFGARALAIILVSVISCVLFEYLYQKIARKKVTINDLSAVVTGMLLAFVLPVTVPYYDVVIGAFVAIVITKQLFGGIGHNFMNPALIGRAFLLASFPVALTKFTNLRLGITEKIADVVTSATPLSDNPDALPTFTEQLLGKFSNGMPIGGCIGETCIAAILLGGAYLVIRRVISLRIPLSYLITMVVMALLFKGRVDIFGGNTLGAVFSGGVCFGAFFMATDYVTTPTTRLGQIIFGVGCGFLTSVIRFWGGYPEGVTYAILFMNVLTPLIDKWIKPKAFGFVKNA